MYCLACCCLLPLLLAMSSCSICASRLSVRGGGICFECRTSGDTVIEDSRAAVLGYCPNCGGRLRGKGKGYCPAKSKGLCRRFTMKQFKITEAIDYPIDKGEQEAKAGTLRPPRPVLKRRVGNLGRNNTSVSERKNVHALSAAALHRSGGLESVLEAVKEYREDLSSGAIRLSCKEAFEEKKCDTWLFAHMQHAND